MKSLLTVPTLVFFVMFFVGVRSCESLEKEMEVTRGVQTYQCSFHDKPLVLTGWSGKVSIRKYTMKDMERGTVIKGIKHYARKCKAIPIILNSEQKNKLNTLTDNRDRQSYLNLLYLLLTILCVVGSSYLCEVLDEKEREKKLCAEKKEREAQRQRRAKERKEEERRLELLRGLSRQAQIDRERKKTERREELKRISEEARIAREERKRKKRELYESNRLKKLEKNAVKKNLGKEK